MKKRVVFALLCAAVPCCYLFGAGVSNTVQGPTVTAAQISTAGHLILMRSDGTKLDAGALPASASVIPIGTPDSSTSGMDGQMMMDSNYIYTFLSGSWSKTPRLNLAPK